MNAGRRESLTLTCRGEYFGAKCHVSSVTTRQDVSACPPRDLNEGHCRNAR